MKNALLAVLLTLMHSFSLAAVPKNVVVSSDENAITLDYSFASWKTSIRGIDVFSCKSTKSESDCVPMQNRLAPADHKVRIEEAGLWLVHFVVGIDQSIFGSTRVVEWRQYVNFNKATSSALTQEIRAIATKHQPKFSFHAAETFFPVDASKFLGALKVSDLEQSPRLQGGDSGVVDTDNIVDLMRFNGELTNRIAIKKASVEGMLGASAGFPIYWTYELTQSELYVTYTLFFASDKKESGIGNHSLDRESVTVVFSRDGNDYLPSRVVYGAHIQNQTIRFLGCSDSTCQSKGVKELARWVGDGASVPWQNAPKVMNSPVAYVAKGTHALYPAFGFYEVCEPGCLGLGSEPAGHPGIDKIVGGTLRHLDIGATDLNHLSFSGQSISVSTLAINTHWNRLAPFVRNTAAEWVKSASSTFGDCLASGQPCSGYVHNAVTTSSFTDEFSDLAVVRENWNISGPVSVSGGLAEFGASGSINTSGKIALSGSRIVIEARMAGPGLGRDTAIILVDESNPANLVIAHDTNYCNWGMAFSGSGIFEITNGQYECGGSNKVVHTGTSTNQFMEYRLTINGSAVLLERGPTLANITETTSATLSTSIDGKKFYIILGTAGPGFSPGVFDWIKVTTDSAKSGDFTRLKLFGEDFTGPILDTTKWTVESVGGSLATYSLSDGFLNVSVAGGSCGRCGVSDGARFRPKVQPLTGNFEFTLSMEEVERLSRDSTRPLSTIQLLVTGPSAELGVYVVGDASDNQGSAGHKIITYYRNGGIVTYPLTRDLTVGQYYSMQLRIRRLDGLSFLAFKLSQDAGWTEVPVPNTFPATAVSSPSIVVASGDGGRTVANSSLKVKFDHVSIDGAGILNPSNKKRYEVISCGTWAQCRSAAAARGGNLVTIRSEAEQDWLVSTFASTRARNFGFWIGLTDELTEGQWRWVSGEPLTFAKWLPGQPSNSVGGEHYAHLWWYGLDLSPPNANSSLIGWNDVNVSGSGADITQAIVEYKN